MSKRHAKSVRIYLDGYDISGFANQVDLNNEMDNADTTTFASNTKEYVVGNGDDSVAVNGFFDDDDEAHTILAARIGSATHLMVAAFQLKQAPCWAGSADLESSYTLPASIGGATTFSAKFMSSGTVGMDVGELVMPKTQFTGNPAAGSYDAGLASNAGARFYLQNFGSYNAATAAAALGTVLVRGGTDAAFTASGTILMASFGSMGVTPSGSAISYSGSVPRFIRVEAIGSPHVAVAMKRL